MAQAIHSEENRISHLYTSGAVLMLLQSDALQRFCFNIEYRKVTSGAEGLPQSVHLVHLARALPCLPDLLLTQRPRGCLSRVSLYVLLTSPVDAADSHVPPLVPLRILDSLSGGHRSVETPLCFLLTSCQLSACALPMQSGDLKTVTAAGSKGTS